MWLIEIPFVIAPLVIGELVLLLMLVHADPTIPVRVVAAAQLAATAGWLAYLGRLVSSEP